MENNRIYCLSLSRFNRRFHAIPESTWEEIFFRLAEQFKSCNSSKEYIIDSFPIEVCDNIRLFSSKIYSEEDYRGYIASKKRYFFGLKVHMIVSADGSPVEFAFNPGSMSDIKAFQNRQIDLPKGAKIYADRA